MTREEFAEAFLGEDEALLHVRQDIAARGMRAISVPPELGRLLTLLVRLSGARNVLEIGALGGYSGICLARGLPEHGRLTSLELDPAYAEAARRNLERAGLGDRVRYLIGPAADSLGALHAAGERFDFFFIDADKPNYPVYLEFAIRLANPGAVIAADNVLLRDRMLDNSNTDPSVVAMREFLGRMRAEPRLEPVVLPVRDGFAIARVR